MGVRALSILLSIADIVGLSADFQRALNCMVTFKGYLFHAVTDSSRTPYSGFPLIL